MSSRREIHLRAHDADTERIRLTVCEVCGDVDGLCEDTYHDPAVDLVLCQDWLLAQIHEPQET